MLSFPRLGFSNLSSSSRSLISASVHTSPARSARLEGKSHPDYVTAKAADVLGSDESIGAPGIIIRQTTAAAWRSRS